MECSACGAPLRKRCRKCPECGAIQGGSSAVASQQPQPAQIRIAKQGKRKAKATRRPQTKPVAVAELQTVQATDIKHLELQAVSASATIAEEAEPTAAEALVVEQPAAQPVPSVIAEPKEPRKTAEKEIPKPAPSLIEFPGVAKTSIPQWRKELGERVREVQEKRAREAMLETVKTVPEGGRDELKTAPLLELLPQADLPQVNPLVEAALRRIERANANSQFSGNTAIATVVAYDEQPEAELEILPSSEGAGQSTISEPERKPQNGSSPPEKTHNLAMVPPPVVTNAETPQRTPKPKRMIRGDHDPALNYLDSIPTTVGVDVRQNHSAPLFYRIFSATVDLWIVCLLWSPVVALIKLMGLNWQDFRVITFAGSTLLVIGFLYLTINTALTGRTLGMRLFSLRVVDARTGLIPTGTQSAGRALVYMLSLASAGILLMYMFVDSEKHTAHDRFSRTAVIRV